MLYLLCDFIVALWAMSLLCVGAFAYFRGARKQLNVCREHLRKVHSMEEVRWGEMDISKKRRW